MKAPYLLISLVPGLLSTGFAGMVVLEYEAEASTVVGNPFGLNVPRLTVVTGRFVYETDGAMDLNGSDQRGHYQLLGGGGFTARFLDGGGNAHLLSGSIGPWLEVEDIDVGGGKTIDTFRFWDGNDAEDKGGIMTFDGTADGEYFLTFAMTDGSGDAFPDDSLPEIYPMTGVKGPIGYPYSHTFVIGDGAGRMLLQLNRLWQAVSGERGPVIGKSGFVDGEFEIEFESKEGETYAVEFSSDLERWDTIATGLAAEGSLTTYRDSGVAERLGAIPGAAYYRVRVE